MISWASMIYNDSTLFQHDFTMIEHDFVIILMWFSMISILFKHDSWKSIKSFKPMKINQNIWKHTPSLDHNIIVPYFRFSLSYFYKKTWSEATFPKCTCQTTECTWLKLSVLGSTECSWPESGLRYLILGHRQVDSVSVWVHLDSECSFQKSESKNVV